MSDDADAVEAAIQKLSSGVNTSSFHRKDCLSTGLTLLNLELSGYPDVSIPKGSYVVFPGESEAGKTVAARMLLAEASISPNFKDYTLVYDDVERGALMDNLAFFGPNFCERVEPPFYVEGYDKEDIESRGSSFTIEEFYFNVRRRCEKGPCIYVLDSMDALTSEYELKKTKEKDNELSGGRKAKGDYGDGKAKYNARNIRALNALLVKSGSILIIITQAKEKMDAGANEDAGIYAGGKALKFYAFSELWFYQGAQLRKTYRGKERQIGTVANIRIKKNRSTGRKRGMKAPIYTSSGFSDTESCVDYLFEEEVWKSGDYPGLDLPKGVAVPKKKETLIQRIEEHDLEFDLIHMVHKTWSDIEKNSRAKRKSKYQVLPEGEEA